MGVFLYPGIPEECLPVLERCVTNKLINVMPDQLTVNQYESGQGESLPDLCHIYILFNTTDHRQQSFEIMGPSLVLNPTAACILSCSH